MKERSLENPESAGHLTDQSDDHGYQVDADESGKGHTDRGWEQHVKHGTRKNQIQARDDDLGNRYGKRRKHEFP